MGLFCAPAWMLKSKGSSPAESLGISDDDPYETRKKVTFKLSDFTYDSSKYTISFIIEKTGFTTTGGYIWAEVNRDENDNKIDWDYINIQIRTDLSKTGRQTWNFSRVMNLQGSAAKKKQLDYAASHSNSLYFIFLTDTEVCNDQQQPKIT